MSGCSGCSGSSGSAAAAAAAGGAFAGRVAAAAAGRVEKGVAGTGHGASGRPRAAVAACMQALSVLVVASIGSPCPALHPLLLLFYCAPAAACCHHTRFVDPNDPSTVYLSQPVDESQRLHYQPTYAANYGAAEKYEPMNLRP